MKPMKRRKICIDLPIELYQEMEEKADRRHLDKTNYIIYLIRQDKDDLFSQKAADALKACSGIYRIFIRKYSGGS